MDIGRESATVDVESQEGKHVEGLLANGNPADLVVNVNPLQTSEQQNSVGGGQKDEEENGDDDSEEDGGQVEINEGRTTTKSDDDNARVVRK